MKVGFLVTSTALIVKIIAENNFVAQQNHEKMDHRRKEILGTRSAESTCSCTTKYFTYTGEGTLYFPSVPFTSTKAVLKPSYSVPNVISTPPAVTCPLQAVITVTETRFIYLSSSRILSSSTKPIISHLTNHFPTPTSINPPTLIPILSKSPDILLPSLVNPAPSSSLPNMPANGQLGSDGNLWAITFSPFNNDKTCKSTQSIWADISLIRLAGFKAIRVYGTECSGLESISSATSFHGMKLIVGIFISESGVSGAKQQVTHILEWGKWDIVDLIVIGNEALFNRHTSPQELAEFIKKTKLDLRSAGYNGPCTTAEPLNIWQENSGALCDVVDLVGCNIHPFFNPEVDASHAGSFVLSQLQIVEGICPGKRGINLECGWPSAGECNGKACPGKAEQEIAVAGIRSYAGNMSVMFTYTDDYWKSPGAFKVEQSFGLIKLLTSG